MGDTTGIDWTDGTWNPVQGCTKVSAGCRNCYMMRDKARYGQDGTRLVLSSLQTFNAPLAKHGPRSTKGEPGTWKWRDGMWVFVCSWSDFYHVDADPVRSWMWDVIRARPGIRWQILTKRTDRILDHLPPDWGNGWPNVIHLASVENQEMADKRIPELLLVPGRKGLSVEPMLDRIELRQVRNDHADGDALLFPLAGEVICDGMNEPVPLRNGGISWVICGGESGPDARPMHPDWARSIRDQCQAAGVPFFFKQWGEWAEVPALAGSGPARADQRHVATHNGGGAEVALMRRVGKRVAGRLLDGRTWDEMPRVSR